MTDEISTTQVTTGEEPEMKKIIGWAMVGAMSFGALTACGSDSKSTKTTNAPSVTEAGGGSGSGSGNAAVDQFCKDTEELAKKIKEALADPSKLAALQADVTKFTTDAAALSSANPADAQKITDCAKALTDSLAGG